MNNPATSNSSTLKPNSKIELFDTHCHIHDPEFASKYAQTDDEVVKESLESGVTKLMCVGTDLKSSLLAISFVQSRDGCYCSLAIHPHEAEKHAVNKLIAELDSLEKLIAEGKDKIVAIGECGLDYFYHADEKVRDSQKKLLVKHIEIAKKYNLPMIFHIRDADVKGRTFHKNVKGSTLHKGGAFDDFFKIIDKYKGIEGVVHSFSAGPEELKGVLARGLYVGLNGIMTFTKHSYQLTAARMVPLSKMVLETDAPFLTPAPFRGTMCKPKHISVTAKFLSELRGESLEDLAKATTQNAKQLFGIK